MYERIQLVQGETTLNNWLASVKQGRIQDFRKGGVWVTVLKRDAFAAFLALFEVWAPTQKKKGGGGGCS